MSSVTQLKYLHLLLRYKYMGSIKDWTHDIAKYCLTIRRLIAFLSVGLSKTRLHIHGLY